MLTTTKLTKKEVQQMEKKRELHNRGWDELLIGERIERMREVIKQNNDMIHRELGRLRTLTDKLEKHSHKENGDIVIPLQGRGYGMDECSAKSSSQKVWF